MLQPGPAGRRLAKHPEAVGSIHQRLNLRRHVLQPARGGVAAVDLDHTLVGNHVQRHPGVHGDHLQRLAIGKSVDLHRLRLV